MIRRRQFSESAPDSQCERRRQVIASRANLEKKTSNYVRMFRREGRGASSSRRGDAGWGGVRIRLIDLRSRTN